MPAYFSDKLTIEDAVLFFSGLGKIILGLLTSIKRPQRMAFDVLLTATEHVLIPVHFKSELPDLHLQMARAQTEAEIALPLCSNTIASHAFLEVFLPGRGRVARGGSLTHLHMAAFERFNKMLRSLVKQVSSYI